MLALATVSRGGGRIRSMGRDSEHVEAVVLGVSRWAWPFPAQGAVRGRGALVGDLQGLLIGAWSMNADKAFHGVALATPSAFAAGYCALDLKV